EQLEPAQPLRALPEVSAPKHEAQRAAVGGREGAPRRLLTASHLGLLPSGSPSASYAINASSASSASSGRLDVKPCSAWATTKRAEGFGRTSSARSRQWTPRNLVSKRL